MAADIFAAGGVVWREVDGTRRVGVVHRHRYGGDVTLPKGKLEAGEAMRACAVREVREELGVLVELADFAGVTTYRSAGRDKYVFFWEMDWVADCDDGPDGDEVTARRWLSPSAALSELSYDTERAILHGVVERAG